MYVFSAGRHVRRKLEKRFKFVPDIYTHTYMYVHVCVYMYVCVRIYILI